MNVDGLVVEANELFVDVKSYRYFIIGIIYNSKSIEEKKVYY